MWNLKINKRINFFEKLKVKFDDNKFLNKYNSILAKTLSKRYFGDDRYAVKYEIKLKKLFDLNLIIILVILILAVFNIVNKGEYETLKTVERIQHLEFDEADKEVTLIAKIYNENFQIEDEYKIYLPKKEPTPEQVVDRLLNVITCERILGDNKNLNEVHTKLNLETENAYDANIHWESLNGYVDVNNGEILRKNKGEGNVKDVLKVTISYLGITKVKEFTINILEKDKSLEEIELEEAKKELQEMVREKRIFFMGEADEISLINAIGNSCVTWYEKIEDIGKSKTNMNQIIIIMLIGILILFNVREIKNIYDRDKKRIEELEKEFPNFISQYILLNKAGYNLVNALEYLCIKPNKSIFYNELKKMLKKIEYGKPIYQTLDEFGKETGSEVIRKFTSGLISNMKRGNKNINEFFKEELKKAHENKKDLFRRKAEKNAVALIFPFILILVATMIIVVYPAIISLEI